MRSGAPAVEAADARYQLARHDAALVQAGLLERRADPVDGRACLLVPTDKAGAVLSEHNDIRLQHFSRMLSDWSDRDLRRFAALLQRFTTDFDHANNNWLTERIARQSHSAEGNH